VSPEVTCGGLVPGLYLARDTELDLEIALRILPRGFDDPARMQRILQRTRAALVLEHRNIASIYKVGAASGEWFVATEYAHGVTRFESRLPFHRRARSDGNAFWSRKPALRKRPGWGFDSSALRHLTKKLLSFLIS